MGRLAIDSSGPSNMAEGDVEGRDGVFEGRKRSEGGERDTRKRRREEGEVAKEALKAECGKCGELIFYIVPPLNRSSPITCKILAILAYPKDISVYCGSNVSSVKAKALAIFLLVFFGG